MTGTFMLAKAVANEILKTNVTASMVFVASMSGYVSNKVITDKTIQSDRI